MVARRDIPRQHVFGFTLLELLVVLAIAGALMALVPPMVSAVVPGTRAKAAALELASTLRDARNLAIARSQRVEVEFDSDNARYAIVGGEASELPRGLALVLIDAGGKESPGRTRLRPSEEPTYTLRFYPDGSSNGVRAQLGEDDSGYVVSVDWLLGRVSVGKAGDDVS